MFYLNGFTQLITKPTCRTKDSQTLTDIIATNSVENISHVGVIVKSLSDHNMVVCVRKINYKQFLPKIIRCRDYKRYNSKSMKIYFSNVYWQPVINETDINTPLNLFNKILTETFNQHAKAMEKKVKECKCPLIGDDVKKLMNEQDQVLRKAKKTNSENKWSRYKNLRNQCNNLLKKNRSQCNKNLIEENSSNPKKFWKCVKDVFPIKQRVSSQSLSKSKSKVILILFKCCYFIDKESILVQSLRFATTQRTFQKSSRYI